MSSEWIAVFWDMSASRISGSLGQIGCRRVVQQMIAPAGKAVSRTA